MTFGDIESRAVPRHGGARGRRGSPCVRRRVRGAARSLRASQRFREARAGRGAAGRAICRAWARAPRRCGTCAPGRRAAGWSPELARRALPALRLAGASALGPARRAAARGPRRRAVREGQMVVRNGWLRPRPHACSRRPRPARPSTAAAAQKGLSGRARAALARWARRSRRSAWPPTARRRHAPLTAPSSTSALDRSLDAVQRLRIGALWPSAHGADRAVAQVVHRARRPDDRSPPARQRAARHRRRMVADAMGGPPVLRRRRRGAWCARSLLAVVLPGAAGPRRPGAGGPGRTHVALPSVVPAMHLSHLSMAAPPAGAALRARRAALRDGAGRSAHRLHARGGVVPGPPHRAAGGRLHQHGDELQVHAVQDAGRVHVLHRGGRRRVLHQAAHERSVPGPGGADPVRQPGLRGDAVHQRLREHPAQRAAGQRPARVGPLQRLGHDHHRRASTRRRSSSRRSTSSTPRAT